MSAITDLKLTRKPLAVIAGLATRVEAIAAAASVPTWMVFLAATALGSWALWLYSDADLTLAYGDAIAHLNIARGVVDSVTPSFSQLGGVWLPLPHLLMLPIIWNDTLWHTGLSGSIVSVLAFGFATAYIYRSIQALTQNGLAALLGSALFATNANLLYMQATPMAETLTIFLVLGATFHLLRWAQGGSLIHFALSATFVLAATMTRYETWVLVPAGIAVVAVTSFKRHRSVSHVEGFTLAWGFLACYGIFLWLLYSQVIFGDMLYFSSGPGAATAYAGLTDANGLLPTKHDPVVSASVFGWIVIDNLGLPLVVASVAGSLLLLVSRVALPIKLAALLPFSLFVFHVASLTAGQSVVWSPHSFPNDFYNTRYGLLMLPAAVIAASYLAARPLRGGGGSIGLLVLGAALLPQLLALPSMAGGITDTQNQVKALEKQEVAGAWVDSNFPFLKEGQPVTLVEALIFDQGRVDTAAKWIGDYARDGKILISAQANHTATLMFRSGLPLSRFISEGNKPYFSEELQSPGRHTRWIVYQPEEALDSVRQLVKPNGPAGFRLVFESGGFQVFERSDETATTSNGLSGWFSEPIGWPSP
jgi:hypothetical protein